MGSLQAILPSGAEYRVHRRRRLLLLRKDVLQERQGRLRRHRPQLNSRKCVQNRTRGIDFTLKTLLSLIISNYDEIYLLKPDGLMCPE